MNTPARESTVRDRYRAAAQAVENTLCCPVEYNEDLLKVIPAEVIEKDYGCGDPSRHLHPGETVLDLGSGTGKICFIAAQIVGPTGRVLGIDMTDEMLAVARRNAPIVASRLGYANVEFRKGRIQDLALDLDRLDAELQRTPLTLSGANAFLAAQARAAALRREHPLVPDQSVDVVVSNCVLNLVDSAEKQSLFHEIHRVLKPGGRAVISDIVSDAHPPAALQQDPDLWSGCISGALREDLFLQAFEDAGFHGLRLLARGPLPWRTVAGIHFRTLTVEASKSKNEPAEGERPACTAIYRGPFREVLVDGGLRLRRGQKVPLDAPSFRRLQAAAYDRQMFLLEPGGNDIETVHPPVCPDPGPPALLDTVTPVIPAASAANGSCCDGAHGQCG
jgi:SAM-dependent methyltransferase